MPAVPTYKPNPSETVRSILTGETFGTVLLVLFVDMIGDEKDEEGEDLGLKALQWHPQMIKEYIESRWGVNLPIQNFDKLMAAITIVTTNLFFVNLDRFIKLCNILSGHEFDFTQFDIADPTECAWGIYEALLLSPPEDVDKNIFADEIKHYITYVLKEEGFVKPPDILRIAIDADFSSQIQYDFADDPEFFQAIYQVQEEKTSDLEDTIRGNLLSLLMQLKDLPLKHGSSTEIEKQLSNAIKKSVK